MRSFPSLYLLSFFTDVIIFLVILIYCDCYMNFGGVGVGGWRGVIDSRVKEHFIYIVLLLLSGVSSIDV